MLWNHTSRAPEEDGVYLAVGAAAVAHVAAPGAAVGPAGDLLRGRTAVEAGTGPAADEIRVEVENARIAGEEGTVDVEDAGLALGGVAGTAEEDLDDGGPPRGAADLLVRLVEEETARGVRIGGEAGRRPHAVDGRDAAVASPVRVLARKMNW